MQLLTMPMPLSPEVIDDRVATVLDAGANITLNYDDAANVLTISAATSATGAPTDAEYVTGSVNGTLSAERVLTDTATVTWDRTTPGQIKASAVVGTSYTDEQAQDAVGNILQDSATIDYVYNDTIPYITGLVKDNSITESMLSLSDNTTKDASASAHGLLPKLTGTATHYLDGTGAWSTPASGGGGESVVSVGAIVRRTTSLSLTASTLTAIPFTSELRDDANFWEGVTNPTRLTIATAGWYTISATLNWDTTANTRTSYIRLDGTTIIAEQASTALSDLRQNLAMVYYLNAGQYVEIAAFLSSTSNLDSMTCSLVLTASGSADATPGSVFLHMGA